MDEEHFKDTPYPDLEIPPYTYQNVDEGECWVLFMGKKVGESVKSESVGELVDFLNTLHNQQGGIC